MRIPAQIATESQKLEPSAIITMFSLDMGAVGGPVVNYHGGTNGKLEALVWQGVTYYPFPVKADGFEYNGRGQLPRPKLSVANVTSAITALILQYGDPIGCKVTRKRTLAKFLDPVNFPDGTNPTADPTAAFPDDIYFIEQRTVETREVVEFQLAAAFDFQGLQLPRRPIIQNVCIWKYRGAECGWTGGYFTIDDAATGDATQDACSKRLTGCQCRYGSNSPLPYGAFPAAGSIHV